MAQLIPLDRVAANTARHHIPLYVPLGIVHPVDPLVEVRYVIKKLPILWESAAVVAVIVDQRLKEFLGEVESDATRPTISLQVAPGVAGASFERWDSRPPPAH